MRRNVRLGLLAATLLLVGLTGGAVFKWAHSERRADALARELSAAVERVDRLGTQADKQTTLSETISRRLKDLRSELAPKQLRLRNLNAVEAAFIRPGQELYQAHILDPQGDRLLLLEWNDRKPPSTSGLQIWKSTPRKASTLLPTSWEMTFQMEPYPEAEYMSIGPPVSARREPADATSAFFTAFGDVTGDGRSDVAVQQWNTGTGGCGVVRVLENRESGMSEIFRRDDCDHRAQIRAGELLYISALTPKGCDAAHGCGQKREWMRWNGSSWNITRVKKNPY